MREYKRYSIALTPLENEKFLAVKKHTGFGVTKIFKAMVDVLSKDLPTENIKVEEEI